MPKRFVFSSSDILVANRWLDKKLSINRIDAKESIFSTEQALILARNSYAKIDCYQADELMSFCQQHLTTAAFDKLKGTLRAARKRQRALTASGNKKRSIDLDFWAHTVLAGVAKSRGITLSQLITENFEKEYLEVSSSPARSE